MEQGLTKRLIISAVNFIEGGPLTALRECLTATRSLGPEWEVVALVHDRQLFDHPWVTFREFPKAKTSWLQRLYHEYWLFQRIAEEYRPEVWLSLHDTSPRVRVPRQVVYCHNPSPFYRSGWKDLRWDPRFFLFTLFYRYLYGINIHANDLVVVQQDWLRQAFRRMYGVQSVAVAHPVGATAPAPVDAAAAVQPGVFLYPALPRTFKNFEVLCEAAELLQRKRGGGFEVRLTLSGTESGYAAQLYRRYGQCPALRFIGRQNAEQMRRQYGEAAAVVFPSKLETWGLPISETKLWNKPLLAADLPYAHEAVGAYDKVAFFPPDDAQALAVLMESVLDGHYSPPHHPAAAVAQPFAADWAALLQLVIGAGPEAQR